MTELLVERSVACPACWEGIELQVDLSAGDQVYTEDCTVCCRPMTVTVVVFGTDAAVTVEAEG